MSPPLINWNFRLLGIELFAPPKVHSVLETKSVSFFHHVFHLVGAGNRFDIGHVKLDVEFPLRQVSGGVQQGLTRCAPSSRPGRPCHRRTDSARCLSLRSHPPSSGEGETILEVWAICTVGKIAGLVGCRRGYECEGKREVILNLKSKLRWLL